MADGLALAVWLPEVSRRLAAAQMDGGAVTLTTAFACTRIGMGVGFKVNAFMSLLRLRTRTA